jgi:DNA-binding NarL/FixJ family response regulator
MPSTSKVTILLADEDALRRDGLAAVLGGTEHYEVVAKVPDGPSALQEIRQQRPDVAVVDLNLPGIHGIELVRRVRSEALRTRILIVSGTSDDEIIREVVRAGGDGYLLKNGPARHLIDAISYVRDGGQYFSPQLHRDGRDRHLLEEPPRLYAERADAAAESGRGAGASEDAYDDGEAGEEERPARPSRGGRPKPRAGARRTSPPLHWRERMKEEAGAPGLEDRDYEIMSMMADGIRPILDRLDEIDDRVALMEVGDAPIPASPRDWLNHEIADTLTRGGDIRVVPRTASELEARLPEMIEEAVTKRFNQMAGKLQQEIEETHVRTLETFVKNIQVKLVQRVSALEQDMSKQAEAMHQLRESSLRTEDNLSRLISGVDKLAQDLPKRLANAAAAAEASETGAAKSRSAPSDASPFRPVRRKSALPTRTRKIVGLAVVAAVLLAIAAWAAGLFGGSAKSATSGVSAATSAAPQPAAVAPPPQNADTRTKMLAAQQYADRKDYPMAEDLYKQVLNSEPNNAEALQGLATVLYRQDKIDEAAATLDRIPK